MTQASNAAIVTNGAMRFSTNEISSPTGDCGRNGWITHAGTMTTARAKAAMINSSDQSRRRLIDLIINLVPRSRSGAVEVGADARPTELRDLPPEGQALDVVSLDVIAAHHS